jgi:hypothetical protein
MKKLAAAVLCGLFAIPAFAYQDGVYKCPGEDVKSPADVYELQTLNLGGVALPYLSITRTVQIDSKMTVNKFQGIAHRMVIDGVETLLLGSIELQIKNGKISGCTL